MKVPGWQVVVACLVMVVFLIWPVHANPIDPLYMQFFFRENNEPIDDPVNFTITCYGLPVNETPEISNAVSDKTGKKSPEMLYSWSRYCAFDNETRYPFSVSKNCDNIYDYEWYLKHITGLNFSSCNLEGYYKGRSFVFNNFTTDLTSSCNHYYENHQSDKGAYVVSLKDEEYCETLSRLRYESCYQTDMKNSSLSSSYIADQCARKERDSVEVKKCVRQFSHNVNESEFNSAPYSRYCKYQFDIPSDNQSPVESLYCTLQQFFGGKCE